MSDPENLHTKSGMPTHIHFVGIAGSAMGSVAIAMKRNGILVTGSDHNVYPPMSDVLNDEGIEFNTGFDVHDLDPVPDLTVIGNVVSRGNTELEYILQHKIPYCSLAELIRDYGIKDKTSHVISGTHGKSTTTTLLAWIMTNAGKNPGYMIGGVPIDLPSACVLTDGDDFIIEGDEYDTAFFDKRSKFIHYKPNTLIINNLEYDHVDIFPDFVDMKKSFYNVINIVSSNGLIIANGDDKNVHELLENHLVVQKKLVRVVQFGYDEHNDWQISDVHHKNHMLQFSLTNPLHKSFTIQSPTIGKYQTYNITAAVAAAINAGIEVPLVQKSVQTFRGLKRRMDCKETTAGIVVIDDFAHHPSAIREVIGAVRAGYQNSKIWAVVEPRSNSMRRTVFQSQLVEALSKADTAIIAHINAPEKIRENERLQPEKIVKELTSSGSDAKYIPNVDDIVSHIKKNADQGDIIITMSNGNFDNVHEKLINAFQ